MSTDSDGSHDDGGNEEFERLVQAIKHELAEDPEFSTGENVITRRGALGTLLGLGSGFGLAGMTGTAEAAGESWGSASGTVGTDGSPLAGLNVSDGDLQSLQMVDTAESPTEAGEFRQNAGDVEVYTGGGVMNLTNIGSGGGGVSGFTASGGDQIAAGDAALLYTTTVPDGSTFDITEASLLLSDGTAAPTDLDLDLIVNGSYSQAILTGDGTTVKNKVQNPASYSNSSGSKATVSVVVNNGAYSQTGTGSSQNAYGDVTAEVI